MNEFTGVILAGGKSARMGQNKAALMLNGISFLDHGKNLLASAGASEILVSANDKSGIPDIYPSCGPLSGIHAALQQTHNNLLIIPVDMPLLTCAQLTPLVTHGQYVPDVAHYERLPLPLFVANNVKVRSAVLTILEKRENLSIRSLITQLDHVQLRVSSSKLFSNVNTMNDYNDLTDA